MTGVMVLLAGACAAWAGWLATAPRPVDPRRSGLPPPGRGPARARRSARQSAAAPVGELISALAAELSAGQPLSVALEHAGAGLDPDPCPRARRAAATGGDVPAALRADAQAPGGQALVALAACWAVAQRSGAGLADALDRLGEGVRAAEQSRAQLDGEVASVRASARLLALLPVLGLLIGQLIGADPLGWLTGHWAGRGVLAAGIALQLAGLAWLQRMVGSARRAL